MNKKLLKTRNVFLYIFILAVAGLFATIYLLPNVSDAFKKTVIIEYGGIVVKDQVSCYIVRDETVYLSNSQGDLQYFVQEGDQIRKGTKVLEILPSKSTYAAEKRGMASYYIDGLEGYFKPETMNTLKYDETKKLKIEVKNTNRKSTEINEPIFKIINSDIWYVVYWINKESIINYTKGNKVKIILPNEEVQGIISDIIQEGDSYFITLKFNRYYDGLPKLRKIDAEVVTSDYKGLTIPNECITTLDNKIGVYVKDVSGDFIFKPIKVLTSDGVNSLVECTYFYENTPEGQKKIETVDIYDEVLKKV